MSNIMGLKDNEKCPCFLTCQEYNDITQVYIIYFYKYIL